MKKIIHVAPTISAKRRSRIRYPAGTSPQDDSIPLKPLAGVITVYLVAAGFTYNVFNCAILGIPSDSFDLGQANVAAQAYPVILERLLTLLFLVGFYLVWYYMDKSSLKARRLLNYVFVTLGFVGVVILAASTAVNDAKYTLTLVEGSFVGTALSIRPDRVTTYTHRLLHAANSAKLFVIRQNAEYYFVLLPADGKNPKAAIYWIPKADTQHERSESPI